MEPFDPDRAKRKFASAIKLRPAGREWRWCLEFKNTKMCSAKPWERGISLEMSRNSDFIFMHCAAKRQGENESKGFPQHQALGKVVASSKKDIAADLVPPQAFLLPLILHQYNHLLVT